jgi:ketosteroid isomerase-like protein
MDTRFTTRFLDTARSATNDLGAGNHGTLLAVFEAVVRGDFEAFGELLTDDVELDIRGTGLFDGLWRGRKQVVEAARLNFGQLRDQKPEIEGMISQNDAIAVLVRETGVIKADQRGYGVRAVQWFTFSNARIRRIDQIAASL